MKLKKRQFLIMALVGGSLVASEARQSSAGNVTFSNPSAPVTTAVFDSSGTYILQLSVFDGAKTTVVTSTITVVNLSPKLTVGPASAIAGNGVDIIVSLSTGTQSLASLQFDLMLPASLSNPIVATGAAALAAGKSAQANPITGGIRVLVFGLNQTLIGPGQMAVINLRLDPAMLTGNQPLVLTGLAGSDAAGISVPVIGTNGLLAVIANRSPIATLSPSTQTITFPANSVLLTGTVSDDGAPNPPGALTYTWSVL